MPNDKYPKVHPEAASRGWVCGQCQWFASGYNQTCEKLRAVEIDTPACIEFTAYLEDYYHEIIDDKYIHGLRAALRGNRFKINETALLEELKQYNIDVDLAVNKLGTLQDMEAITGAIKTIVGYRSRVVAIYTSLLDLQHDMEEMMSHASLWLYSKYETMRDLKNEGMRQAAFDRLLPEKIAIQKNISKLVATAKYMDEKLDSNERALGKILSAAEKMWFSREKTPPTKGSYI